MSEYKDTVTISTANGPVRINAEDFNPETHKLYDEADDAGKGADDGKGNPDDAGKGVEVTHHADGSLVVTDKHVAPSSVVHTQADEPKPAGGGLGGSLVTKKNKKFVIVNASGETVVNDLVDVKGYDTEKAAWDVILANP